MCGEAERTAAGPHERSMSAHEIPHRWIITGPTEELVQHDRLNQVPMRFSSATRIGVDDAHTVAPPIAIAMTAGSWDSTGTWSTTTAHSRAGVLYSGNASRNAFCQR